MLHLLLQFRVKKLSKVEVKRQLKFGIPLIPNQIAWWIIGLLGKYILTYYHGVADNGILAVANKFPNLITIVNSIFLQAWTESIIKEYNSDDRDKFFSDGLVKFTIFTFSMVACLLPAIKIYNVIAISGEFLYAWKFVPILVIGSSFNSLATFLGTIYTASMKTKQAFTTTMIAAVTNLIMCILLIPLLSIWGFVISNMISFIVFYFVRIRSISNMISLKIKYHRFIPSLALLSISIFVYYSSSVYNQIFAILVLGIASLYLNRDNLLNLLSFITKIKIKRNS